MNRKEYLLTCLGEEAVEVAQRASKALRFGLNEIQADQPFNNSERITEEMTDLLAVYEILRCEGHLTEITASEMKDAYVRKLAKIEKFMKISRQQGTLSE